MLKQIRPAILMIVLFTVLTGLVYPLGHDRAWPTAVSASGQWQPGREERQGDRLRTDRPEFRQRQIFPWPAFGDLGAGPEGCDQDISVPYAADNSAGSNLGPTSKALIARVKGDAATLHARKSRPCRSRLIW